MDSIVVREKVAKKGLREKKDFANAKCQATLKHSLQRSVIYFQKYQKERHVILSGRGSRLGTKWPVDESGASDLKMNQRLSRG